MAPLSDLYPRGSDNYDEDSVPVDMPEGPPEEAAEGDTGKMSQEQANYRRGTPVQHCGICMHYIKSGEGNAGACTKVAGEISPYALTDVYAEAKNPFGPMLGPQERGMIDEMSQSGPDQSRFAQSPQVSAPPSNMPEPEGPLPSPLRIGRQAY